MNGLFQILEQISTHIFSNLWIWVNGGCLILILFTLIFRFPKEESNWNKHIKCFSFVIGIWLLFFGFILGVFFKPLFIITDYFNYKDLIFLVVFQLIYIIVNLILFIGSSLIYKKITFKT